MTLSIQFFFYVSSFWCCLMVRPNTLDDVQYVRVYGCLYVMRELFLELSLYNASRLRTITMSSLSAEPPSSSSSCRTLPGEGNQVRFFNNMVIFKTMHPMSSYIGINIYIIVRL